MSLLPMYQPPQVRRSSRIAGNAITSRQRWAKPGSTIGTLKIFPNELFRMILRQMDLKSLANFARANSLCAEYVAYLPDYVKVTQTASPTLLRMRMLGLISEIPVEPLYLAFKEDHCIACNSYGPELLDVAELEKRCPSCFRAQRTQRISQHEPTGMKYHESHVILRQMTGPGEISRAYQDMPVRVPGYSRVANGLGRLRVKQRSGKASKWFSATGGVEFSYIPNI